MKTASRILNLPFLAVKTLAGNKAEFAIPVLKENCIILLTTVVLAKIQDWEMIRLFIVRQVSGPGRPDG